ncbi:MAG: tetratricopeptide repeat protein [Bradymonadaceae bacterium]|nr:tetratricopeptide repeat protein [Lujinxingiaceae bacterium]
MKRFSQAASRCTPPLLTRWLTIAVLLALPTLGYAEEADKEEKAVQVAKTTQQIEAPSLAKEQAGPQFSADNFVEQRGFESLQRQDEAIVHLRDLIRSTPQSNPQRAEFLFNLSEIYWERSKYYERTSVEKNDECHGHKAAGDAGKLRACEASVKDMLDEAKRLREEAVQLYIDIIKNYTSFKDLDKVYFFLGSNLMEIGKQDQALEIFRRLIADYPKTPFVPNVLLHFGEYYFENSDMRSALTAYQKVTEYPNSTVYSYALYKMAWTYYNLGQKDRALDQFIKVIETAKKRPNDANSNSLVRQTRNDIVRTYAHIGSADKAVGFFKKVADKPEDWFGMSERLAVHYSDMGGDRLLDSTRMYRELISLAPESVKTIDYQYEIVRNQTTMNAYSKESIEELVRLMKLVQIADQGRFKDAEAKGYAQTKARVEELVRNWATTYHREAQRTKSPDLYAMAYFLYKFYLETFPENDHLYATTFFYGELLYQLEKWEEAATAYEKVLAIDPKGQYTEDSVLATVLCYFKIINTSEEQAKLNTNFNDEKKEDKKIPEPREIPDVHKRLLKAGENYIKHVPEGERIVDVKYTMARTYYDFDHLRKSLDLFRDIAFNHPDHRLAVISANLHLDTLNLLQDFDGLYAAVLEYIEKAPIKEAGFRSEVDALHTAIRFKICTVLDDKENWNEASTCFIQFARDFPESDFVDKALYNAALDFERMKEIGRAIQVRVFLLRARPESPLAPQTLFNIGGNFHALAVYSEAARFYELFTRNFPDHKDAEAALANASTFRQGLGQYDRAIQNYERYLELFGKKNPDKAAGVFFQIAKIYEKQDKKREAFAQYENYIKRYGRTGTKDHLLEAHVAIGLHHWGSNVRNAQKQGLTEFERTLKVFEGLPKDEQEKLVSGRDAAAQAKFMIGESVFEKMAAIQIDSPNEKILQERLREKMKIAEEAQKIYEQVILFGRPDWAIAALYRIGTQFQNFADTIRKSPPPSRLTYDQQEIYRGILEDQASMIEQRAVVAYSQALQAARQSNWFNRYSRDAEVRLAALRPREFRKPSEMRAQPNHFSVGFMTAPFIKTVKEDDVLSDFGSAEDATITDPSS